MKIPSVFKVAALFSIISLSACADGHDVVTYAEFKQLRPGMTLNQVSHVIGSNGKIENQSMPIIGALGVTQDEVDRGDEVYVWIN